MKRFIAQLNDGSFINVTADRMEERSGGIFAYDGEGMVAFVDLDAVVCAHVSEKPNGRIEEKK